MKIVSLFNFAKGASHTGNKSIGFISRVGLVRQNWFFCNS